MRLNIVLAEQFRFALEVPDEYCLPTQPVRFACDKLIIGRKAPAHVVIDETSVSNRHGVFAVEKGLPTYRDIGSKWGTLFFHRNKVLAFVVKHRDRDFVLPENLYGRLLLMQVGQVETFLRVRSLAKK